MDERVVIASSVLSGMIECYAPNVFAVLAEFESSFQSGPKFSESESKLQLFESLFERFPRKIGGYKQMLMDIAGLCAGSPGVILNFMAKMVKQVVGGHVHKTPFTVLQGFSTSYDPNDTYHNLLFRYFGLLMLSDLIAQVVVRFGPDDAAVALAHAGVHIVSSGRELPSVFGKLVRQWSVIFSIISETQFAPISRVFQFFGSPVDLTVFISLVKFLRLDVDELIGRVFLGDLLVHIKQNLKRKPTQELVFIGLASLVATLPNDDEMMGKLQQLAFQYRHDRQLMMPALVLMTAVTVKSSKSWERMMHIFRKRIEPVISNKQKVEAALMAFHIWMCGGDIPLEVYFWEWGPNPRGRKIRMVKCNGAPHIPQSDPQSFSNIFMNTFFEKGDFSVCKMQFRDVLVHLASLDFDYFCRIIVPKFMALRNDDPRFITLLMAVPKINTPDFKESAYKGVSSEAIVRFNQTLREKLLKTLIVFREKEHSSGICFTDSNMFITSLSTEADANIGITLSEWNVSEIVLLRVKHTMCESSRDAFTLPVRLIPAIRCVLTEEDRNSQDLVQMLIELSWHKERVIASNAYSICSSMFNNANDEGALKYMSLLLRILDTDLHPEPIFIVLSLLYEIICRDIAIPESMVFDIEAIAFLNLASIYPDTRHLVQKILTNVTARLAGKGIATFLKEKRNQIEKTVKSRVFCHVLPTKRDVMPRPSEKISLETCMMSHYYDIWIFFLSAMMDIVIATGYRPLLERITMRKKVLTDRIKVDGPCRNPSDIGTLVIVLGSQYYSKYFLDSEQSIRSEIDDRTDNRSWVIEILSSLMQSKNDRLIEIAYLAAQHIHYTLITSVLSILGNVDESQLQTATSTVSMILRSPCLNGRFFVNTFRRIVRFLTDMKYQLMKKHLNGPRVIQWTPPMEFQLVRESAWLRDYCTVVEVTFSHLPNNLPEKEWPLSEREHIFRFMVNWAMTLQTSLESLRLRASMALIALCRTGTFFSDSLLFDRQTVTYFGKLDSECGLVVSNLLKFHFEVLLAIYIKACHTQPRAIADRYFDAIIENMSIEHSEIITQLSGQLLVLGLVYIQREHPQAKTLVDKFVDIMEAVEMISDAERIKEEPVLSLRVLVPQIFRYATEAVFWTVFDLLQSEYLHVPAKDIIEATRPWTHVLRLLPKQTVCAQGVSAGLNFFTPYNFLTSLMETTEAVDDDQFRTIACLWVEILKSPDHTDIVPLFVGEWGNSATKQKMFEVLLNADTVNMSQRLSKMCSFAYYYHRKVCMAGDLDLWFTPLLALVYHKNWDTLIEQIPYVINFACLFRDCGAIHLFDVICHHFSVECPDGSLSVKALRDVTDQIIECLRSVSPSYVEIWGNEALEWVLGCSSLEFAVKSFVIYNRIFTPMDKTVINGLMRTVAYHLDHNQDQKSLLAELVSEEFIFMTKVMKGNETLAWNLVCSFLDCRIFVETSLLHSQKIFMECISQIEFRRQAFNNTISIIRPLICHLETGLEAQEIVDVLINRLRSPELMMIVLPIKLNYPHLFPSCQDPATVLSTVNDSVLCKSLVHYSMMLKTASIGVLDSIFSISETIVSKIVNENNRISLSKIYQTAVRSLSKCPSAIKFIQTVCRREPKVVAGDLVDTYEWDRSIEDVARNVKRLLVPDESPIVTITDCHSYTTVTRFLFTDALPKIRPFVAESEMLEGMKRVAKEHKRAVTKLHIKRPLITTDRSMSQIQSEVFDDVLMKRAIEEVLGPMFHPTCLVTDDALKTWESGRTIPVSVTDFLDSAKRSMSICS